jgi:16S rRNA (guanine1516-N2)-methyltransferase
MNLIVTGPLSGVSSSNELEEFLTDIGLPYVPRSGKSLGELLRENGADGVIIWQEEGPVLQMGDEQFFFHPNMAKIRIGAYRKKKRPDQSNATCPGHDELPRNK